MAELTSYRVTLALLSIMLLSVRSKAFMQATLNKDHHRIISFTALASNTGVIEREEVLEAEQKKVPELPPLLQNMADERRLFELNLGKAMDVLRSDYPLMLKKSPDFSIYHEKIYVVDPSGVQLTGLNNYISSFRFLQTFIGFFYNTDRSSVQYRMVYDFARQTIRLSFNVMLIPKVLGNRRNALYLDGISVYKMDSKSGKIVEHRVEKLLLNNIPVRPPYGILTELLQPTAQPIPVGIGAMILPDTITR